MQSKNFLLPSLGRIMQAAFTFVLLNWGENSGMLEVVQRLPSLHSLLRGSVVQATLPPSTSLSSPQCFRPIVFAFVFQLLAPPAPLPSSLLLEVIIEKTFILSEFSRFCGFPFSQFPLDLCASVSERAGHACFELPSARLRVRACADAPF